ncbi:MAG TPA: hypothetical protein VGH79_06390 [Gaiellaceae bacterium]
MSTEDERSVPPDIFSAPPADPQRRVSAAAPYPYVPAVSGGAAGQFAAGGPVYAAMPVTQSTRPGRFRRILSWVAVVWGGLDILFDFHYWSAASGNASYRTGSVLGLILSAALLSYGYREIASHHMRKFRALPWIMGVKLAAITLLIVVLVAIRAAYPANVQINFLSSCEARGADAGYCGCALKWFESHKTFAQFVAVDAESRTTGRVPPDVAEGIAASCPRTTTT